MKITITRDAGLMVVDKIARPVNTRSLPEGVEVVLWDDTVGAGFLQFDELQTEEIQERDLEREAVINADLAANNKPPLEEPLYRTVTIPKRPKPINDFTPYLGLFEEWNAYVPPAPPEPPAQDPRLAEIDSNLNSGQIGGLTRDELKALSVAEYNAWFNATFTTNPQLIGLLRRLTLLVIRRLL